MRIRCGSAVLWTLSHSSLSCWANETNRSVGSFGTAAYSRVLKKVLVSRIDLLASGLFFGGLGLTMIQTMAWFSFREFKEFFNELGNSPQSVKVKVKTGNAKRHSRKPVNHQQAVHIKLEKSDITPIGKENLLHSPDETRRRMMALGIISDCAVHVCLKFPSFHEASCIVWRHHRHCNPENKLSRTLACASKLFFVSNNFQ